MQQLLNVYKPSGLTPLQVIDIVRKYFPQLQNEKIGYAGRLDPLAHGVLLLMVGKETTEQKDRYLHLPKKYEFEALFGFATDTYDALGIVKPNNAVKQITNTPEELQKHILVFIQSKIGKQIQLYPPFSSKTVDGKPLHWWAKNNKLKEIKIPEREIEIFSFELVNLKHITKQDLQKLIAKQIMSVTGEFRQKEITKKWQETFSDTSQTTFSIARFKLSCSSGTYVRSLVNTMGEKFGGGAFTLEILRTKLGEYELTDSLKYV